MDLSEIHKQLEGLENQLTAFTEKAETEIKDIGKVSTDTQAAIDKLGKRQREFADELMAIRQKQSAPGGENNERSWGDQFIKSGSYQEFARGVNQKARFEVKNTLTGSEATVAPDRKPGIVGGAFQVLTLEAFLPSVPTTSNAVEYTREDVFVNAAAETAEGARKPESTLTWTLENVPIATVAHFIKISRQLADDAPALAAYVDNRMRYGVDLRVEQQLVSGNGVSPNIDGLLNAGNYTAHGYADGALGATLKPLVLIRKAMADLVVSGYPPTAIVLNPVDWASIEILLFTTQAGQTLYSIREDGVPRLFGLPVIQSVGMPADQFLVGNFAQAATLHNRQGVVVEMSESDEDNFVRNLITIRAERRLQLAVERPAALRGGDLTPAA